VIVGERLGLGEEQLEAIRLGALLHDVGKIGIRDEVLLKPGRLTESERRHIESHTEVGHRIALPIAGLHADTLACIRSHHEWWDGRGYPDALRGDAIPLAARIVAVVDVWDALSTSRPYKQALPAHEVHGVLRKGRGSHFDPDVVDAFLAVLAEQGEELLALTARAGRSLDRGDATGGA